MSKYVFAMVACVSMLSTPTVAMAADADEYFRVAMQGYWQVPLDAKKLSEAIPNSSADNDWKEFVKILEATTRAQSASTEKLQIDLHAKKSDSERKDIVNAFVLESRNRADEFFSKSVELIDPVQCKKAFANANTQSGSWKYDPLVNHLANVEDATFKKSQELQLERVAEALDRIENANVASMSNDDRKRHNFESVVLQIEQNTDYFNRISPKSRAALVALLMPNGSFNAQTEGYRSNLLGRFKETEFTGKVNELIDKFKTAAASTAPAKTGS